MTSDVTRYPIFVPSGDKHVAAVISVPDHDAQGIVLTLAGTGRHNLIGSTLGAQISERLANVGYATVRVDYTGVGDSPGLVPSWMLSDVSEAAGQARAVLTTTANALGVDRFVTIGTCYGSRVALDLVSSRRCVGAICLAPPVLDDGGLVRAAASAGRQRAIASFLRSHRRLIGPARRLRRSLQSRKLAPVAASAFRALDHARIVFLYGADPSRDHGSARARELIDETVAAQPREVQRRFETRTLPCGALSTFELLPPSDQALVLDALIDDVHTCFSDALHDDHDAARAGQGGPA